MFVCSLCALAYTQTNIYHEFPDSNATWNITAQACCWSNCPGPPSVNPIIQDDDFTYSIEGDSTLGLFTYKKLRKSGSAHTHCSFGSFVNNYSYYNSITAFIREDVASKKVYCNTPSSSGEILLYDFNANVGDTMSNYDMCSVVSSIDSILIGSTYRKRFNIQGSTYSVIEGIGSTAGLFEPFCPFENSGTLNCFRQEFQTLYPDNSSLCVAFTSVEDNNSTSEFIKMYPNPVHDIATIELNDKYIHSYLKLYNLFGSVVRTQLITSNLILFHREDLKSGVYFYEVKDAHGKVTVGKLILQ